MQEMHNRYRFAPSYLMIPDLSWDKWPPVGIILPLRWEFDKKEKKGVAILGKSYYSLMRVINESEGRLIHVTTPFILSG